MQEVFVVKNIKLFIFAILGIVVFCFLINFRYINSIIFAQDNIENPAGWSWNNIFGWHSGNCDGMYNNQYGDYCGIPVDSVLDIGFDGDDVDFVKNIVKDNSATASNGKLSNIGIKNVRNRTGESNFNQSIYFDGKNSFVNFGTNEAFDFSGGEKAFSISVWFKLDSFVELEPEIPRILFSNGDGQPNGQYVCYIYNRKPICIIGDNAFEVDIDQLSIDNWHNLTVTYGNNKFNMYLDYDGKIGSGILIKDGDVINISGANKELLLGQGKVRDAADNQYFKGEIDEFRVFNKMLTKEQVAHNMYHNSNYSVKINDTTGVISGWIWNQSLGWICMGTTCYDNPPSGGFSSSLTDTILHWSGDQSNGIYPHMITGWARAGLLADKQWPPSSLNDGWISLQGNVITPDSSRTYSNCASCIVRDRETGLVGYWKMDDGSSYVVSDSSGFDRSGKIIDINSKNWILNGCVVNNCFSPQNSNNFITIPNIEKINRNNFSFEIWVKMDKAMDTELILGFLKKEVKEKEDSNFKISFDKNRRMITAELFQMKIGASADIIFDKAWHQIFFTADRNNEAKLYIDGIVSKESVVDISEFSNKYIKNSILNIGGYKDMGYWNGKIDLVRMYTKALSKEEIAYNYAYKEKIFCSACFDIKTDNSQNICYECGACNNESSQQGISSYKCNICSRCHKYGLVFDTNTSAIKGYAWGGGEKYGWLEFGPSLGSGIYRSYVSGRYGNIYSKGNIGTDYSVAPPIGSYNASYLIQANGRLINWASESSVTYSNESSSTAVPNFNPAKPWLNYFGNPRGYIAPVYDYPSVSNDYENVLGKIDYNKLKNLSLIHKEMPWKSNPLLTFLDGNVYLCNSVDTLGCNNIDVEITFKNGNLTHTDASGVILVEGNLNIHNNIFYELNSISGSYKSLASVAWIIKGDLIIDSEVTDLAGTFIVLGADGIDCGSLTTPMARCGTMYTGSSDKQLRISGQVIAKNFKFERSYKDSLKSPAELIIYDGRNIINPPIGLGDIMKSLPRWDQIAPY